MAECIMLIMKDLVQSLYLSKHLVQSLCWSDGEHQ